MVAGDLSGVNTPQDERFHDMGLDPRLLRALGKRGLTEPTPVQAKCIPLAMEGKDIVARARTGSGKTLAYLLPALHKILGDTVEGEARGQRGVRAVILVPTRELCQQVRDEVSWIAEYCGGLVTVVQLTAGMTAAAQRMALATSPDVVVTTPGRLAACLRDGSLTPATLQQDLETLVLDEADLLLSYGYEEDLRQLAQHVPRRCQCMLMSATTSADVDRLKKLVLHNPVTLTLTEAEDSTGGGGVSKTVQQFAVRCPQSDKLLHILVMLRLELVQKKALIFVNSIDTGFRLKLFLEKFGVRTAVLNSELPHNSRLHILEEFNRGLFDYLVATDEGGRPAGTQKADKQKGGKQKAPGQQEGQDNGDEDRDEHGEEAGEEEEDEESGEGAGKKRKKKRKGLGDGEFGVVRGIDFKNVRTVINFDLPAAPTGYVHRIGRTGRGRSTGVAVSLVSPEQESLLRSIELALASQGDADSEGERDGAVAIGGSVVQPFPSLTKNAVENMRYRAEDVAHSITKGLIREARAKELRLEMLNSERLKSHFEDNPLEYELLKHDKPLLGQAPAPHLKNIPTYLRDPTAEAAARAVKIARAAMGPSSTHFHAERRMRKRKANEAADPLKSLAYQKRVKGTADDLPEVAERMVGDLLSKKKWRRQKVQDRKGRRGHKRRH